MAHCDASFCVHISVYTFSSSFCVHMTLVFRLVDLMSFRGLFDVTRFKTCGIHAWQSVALLIFSLIVLINIHLGIEIQWIYNVKYLNTYICKPNAWCSVKNSVKVEKLFKYNIKHHIKHQYRVIGSFFSEI